MLGFIKRHKRITVFVLLLVTGGIFWFLQSGNKPIEVTEAKVEVRTITKVVSASGETEVLNGSSKYALVTGTVKKINLSNGVQVKKGDSVISLDPVSLRAGSDTAYSAYLLAKASSEANNRDVIAKEADVTAKRRLKERAEEKYLSDKDVEDRDEFKTASAALKAAEAVFFEAKNSAEYLRQDVSTKYASYLSAWQDYQSASILAPDDGILALEGINEGQQVAAGTKLFSVINANNFSFVSEVDETDIKGIKVGQRAEVLLDSYGNEQIVGSVSEIAAKTKETDSGATAVEVKIKLNKGDLLKIIGLSGDVKIMTETKENATVLPVEYVEEDDKGFFVWQNDNGKAKKARVTEGLTTEDYAEVLGEEITEGASFIKGEKLTEGADIKPAKASESK